MLQGHFVSKEAEAAKSAGVYWWWAYVKCIGVEDPGGCGSVFWIYYGNEIQRIDTETGETYYIISAGLGEDIIERSLGDPNGFAEHLEEYRIAGKIYAANVMDAGLVKNQSIFQKAYDRGKTSIAVIL